MGTGMCKMLVRTTLFFIPKVDILILCHQPADKIPIPADLDGTFSCYNTNTVITGRDKLNQDKHKDKSQISHNIILRRR